MIQRCRKADLCSAREMVESVKMAGRVKKKILNHDLALLCGRVLLVVLFLAGGLLKIKYLAGTAAYLQETRVPGAGEPIAMAAGLFECTCALLILVGYRTRLVAAALFVYLVPATWYTHLALSQMAVDAVVRDNELFQSLKNVAIMGGLVMLFSSGPGLHSIDRK